MAAGAILMGSLQTADRFWSDIGHPQKCPRAWGVFDHPDPDVRAQAGIGWCGGLEFDRNYIDYLSRVRILPRLRARRELLTLCVIAIHERGHEHQPPDFLGIDGEGHEAAGIMQNDVTKVSPPGICIDWSRKLTKSKRKRR